MSNRRRRQDDYSSDSSDEVTITFEVEGEDDDFEVEDGIAIYLDALDSSDKTTLPLLSLLTIMALA